MNSKQQLMDSLTSLISLYHSSSQSPPTNPNPNPRSSILKWLSSLTVHQRQSHLAIVDSNFVQVLLEMNSKILSKGHGLFIVLPDMPSIDRPSLPSVCYRRSHGLLARVSESNESERLIYDSVKMFSSKEGDKIVECSDCSVNCLDSVTVSESFVESVEKFVNVMDGVSNGGFLRGEGNQLGDEWVELEWLKAKGYYGIEAFVANRLEVALRLSWLNCKNGKKRGVKLKEKASLAGVAANVYWRKKGCLDWWGKLDAATKQKVFQTVLGKAAKSLTTEVLKAKSNAVEEDDFWLFRTGTDNRSRFDYTISRPRTVAALRGGSDAEFGSVSSASVSGKDTSLEYIFNSLLVLKDISTMLIACDDHNSESAKEKLFFSSLGSVNTVSNCILRKLRGLLMVVSLDCTKLELLEEVVSWNGPTKKSEEKPGACSHRKKGKARNSKRVTADLISASGDPKLDEPAKVDGFELTYIENNRLASAIQEKDLDSETSLSALNMEHGEGLVNGNVHARKNKKRRNKHKNSCLTGDAEVEVSQRKTKKISAFSDTSKHKPIDASTGEDKKVLNQLQTIQDKKVACTCEASSQTGMESNQLSDEVRRNHFIGSETINYTVASATPPVMPVVERYIVPKSVSPGEGSKSFDSVEITQIQGQDGNSSDSTGAIVSAGCPPYEWPSVAPFHFPSISPHIPAATDRLHLDVGHNWKNHFHPPLLPTVHQVRNQPIENGILSRPMSMSLDWPPMVRSFSGLVPSMTYSYDSGFISRTQPSFQQSKEERMYTGDNMDLSDPTTSQEKTDDHENHWISEEEIEVHTVSGMDYSQYFGGGVMYWNPSDRNGTGFSRPPSLSSDDSSWAWREADMNTTVDDMVAFSSSYSTNGLTSPSAASFCSPFDPMGPTHQALGYVIPGSEVTSNNASGPEENASASLLNLPGCDGEAKTGDSLQYPILRPIIIPSISRERSRSEFKRSHDHKSPCVRIKRPPSPVVLCVPNAPRPPPPSPVGDRKHRGFPTVRSGSSSPRHWGVRGWFHDGINFEESCMRMDGSEVVWPSWRNKSLAARQLTQPLPGALLQDRLIAISQLARDQEHPDVAFPLQPPESLNNSSRKASLAIMHSLLHDEIDSFYKQVTAENMVNKPYFSWAVKRVTRSLQVLWPRSRTNIFGSNATGLSLPTSDLDLVVCLPPVRNLEPIKEAGILEGRNGIKETCLQHAARYLANQEWVKSDSIKIVENTAIPIIMLVVEVPREFVPAATVSHVQIPKEEPSLLSNEQDRSFLTDKDGSESSALPEHSVINNDKVHDTKSVRIDISFKSPSHTGLQTTELVKELTEQFPAATPLAMVLKQFLSDRSLDQSYSGGLSSYCLILMITRFLQHEHHHGRSINQNFGGLLMDFLYFFGNVFDARQMRISVRGNGVYINRERGYSIDPIYIDDPLFPANNVGRNCFRIHQCIKAFADAYTALENELASFPSDGDSSNHSPCKLLPKIIPSIGLL